MWRQLCRPQQPCQCPVRRCWRRSDVQAVAGTRAARCSGPGASWPCRSQTACAVGRQVLRGRETAVRAGVCICGWRCWGRRWFGHGRHHIQAGPRCGAGVRHARNSSLPASSARCSAVATPPGVSGSRGQDRNWLRCARRRRLGPYGCVFCKGCRDRPYCRARGECDRSGTSRRSQRARHRCWRS